ncbi:lanC-like protein 3 homolog [Anopheles bellator]|uniref:lanC-like protein 3 homolog n=1 Tax=Anopheles bellator TaxID=139047 RepID=UPI002649CC4B|nr:lanC-like protein 3 homolog [Anopheles bellator]XP_058058371.1 lanC-like protein 3 homolog [Anopheles bellator]
MGTRYFANPFPDYGGGPISRCDEHIKGLIQSYVNLIVENTKLDRNTDQRGDLYVGDAGIAFMFLRLHDAGIFGQEALQYAKQYIVNAKALAGRYAGRPEERCSFLCGNAGVYAVSAAIAHRHSAKQEMDEDLRCFATGIEVCKRLDFNKNGSDEVLFGRAGYLSGIYWLHQTIDRKLFSHEMLTLICATILESGKRHRSLLPLYYQCYGDDYLGAAHGTSAIMHMLLESPLQQNLSSVEMSLVKNTVDGLLGLQDSEGNFPTTLQDCVRRTRSEPLVHWCHGAAGVVYLMAKAYLVFQEQRYLQSCIRSADLVWRKGLLRKGPGICHGVAGSGYVFLLLYRLTSDPKYLHRALKFMEFLTHEEFIRNARNPDCPFSLYEGYAGTVCFLIDLLRPEKAAFPFMDVFEKKF